MNSLLVLFIICQSRLMGILINYKEVLCHIDKSESSEKSLLRVDDAQKMEKIAAKLVSKIIT